MEGSFRFKRFEVRNESSPLKVGTDAVILGAAMTIPPQCRSMLDIGTGTGVIALMAAQRCPGAFIEGIDIDAGAAGEAACNFGASPWADRMKAICVPLGEYMPEKKFDMVFSNPPYFDASLLNPDSRQSAARHTESLSYREVCEFASKHLTENGRLAMVLPSGEELRVRRWAGSFGLHLSRIVRVKTTPAKAARRIITEFSFSRPDVIEEELVLQEGGERTQQYRTLTEEFYLN